MPAYKGKAGAPKVAVVGDSITNYSTPQVERTLGGTYQYSVLGTPSIDLKDGREQLVKPALATNPNILVVELGINSARTGWDSNDLPHLEGILKDTDAVPCVVWVIPDALDVSYFDNNGPGTLHERILQFKASLEKRLPKNPNVHMAYWGDVERTHPEWYIAGDGLHNSPAGEQAYAEFILSSINSYC
jgi:lysophospholipase L1-like esterase